MNENDPTLPLSPDQELAVYKGMLRVGLGLTGVVLANAAHNFDPTMLHHLNEFGAALVTATAIKTGYDIVHSRTNKNS